MGWMDGFSTIYESTYRRLYAFGMLCVHERLSEIMIT